MSNHKLTKANKQRKIDKNWEALFEHFNILERVKIENFFKITSKQINEFKSYPGGNTDARLMTKFDYTDSLPDIFKNNNLSILPVRRGEYIIGKFNAYMSIADDKTIFTEHKIEKEFPDWITSIDYKKINSENKMLHIASLSGMLKDLFGDEELVHTISGRMGSKSFSFFIDDNEGNKVKIDVENSQIEIDGGYETHDSIILVEAKNNITDNFIVRQLYYPYRLWNEINDKKIVPVYLQYSNGVFNFSVYKFENPYDYSSIKLVERKNFVIAEKKISLENIKNIHKNISSFNDTDVTFPQADSTYRIFDILELVLRDEKISLEKITIEQSFTLRQARYYIDATRYLNLVKGENSLYSLTNLGQELMDLSIRERKLKFIEIVFSFYPFHKVFELVNEKRRVLKTNDVYFYLKQDDLFMKNYSEVTRHRRSSTIARWVNDIMLYIDII